MNNLDLKGLLEKFTRINELSKKAIEELSHHIDADVSNESFRNNLSFSIQSLNKEADELKKLHSEISTENLKCSEVSSVPDTSINDPRNDPIQHSTGACIDKPNAELNRELSLTGCEENSKEYSNEKSITKLNGPGEKNKQCLDASNKLDEDSNLSSDAVKDDDTLAMNKIHGTMDTITADDDDTLTEVRTDSSKEEAGETKPMLKIIDFEKLVDPRNLVLMNKSYQNNTKPQDVSIIVLSSSEDEVSSNNEENISKKNEQGSIRSSNNLQNILSSNQNELLKDIKFQSKPYVKLLRMQYEKMKSLLASSQKEHEHERNLKRKYSSSSSDELFLNELKEKKNLRHSQKLNTTEDEKGSKSKRKCKYRSNSHKKRIENSKEIGSDSSEDDCIQRNSELDDRYKKALEKTKENNKERDSANLSSNEQVDENNIESDVGIDNTDVPLSILEEDQNSTISKTSNDKNSEKNDNSSEENSESSSNKQKKRSEDKNKKDSTLKEKGPSTSSMSGDDTNDDPLTTKSKKNSEEIVVSSNNSDDSDFDTFFKKNRFKHSKKIKELSDSEEEQNKNEETQCKENDNKKTSSSSDNLSDEEMEKRQGQRRRRIRKMDDDSSDSNEATTRRKIKKLISKDSLSDQTKKAAVEENERKQRILEKQRKYNQIYESSDLLNSKVEKLILDVDEVTEQPLLQVDKHLASKLKPHQASGIQFMWDACFESIKRIEKSSGSGCILAHCMGLGKTLQVIALTNTLLEEKKTKVKKVLIVTPLSTVLNWKAEYKNWLSGEESYEVYELASVRAQNSERSCYVKEWHENGGVMLISYSMFRNLSNEKNRKISKKIRTIFIEGLVDPGPDLVICDEGHLLKNEKTSISIAMNKIKTRRRIVLTGTPLQNNLKEYYCMVHFVKPSLLGTYKEYLNRFVNPITNGQYTDSTQYDINLMRRRSHVLHKLLDGIVQRRDYSVLSPYLPPKFEYVLFLTLTETQKKLYAHYLEHKAKNCKEGSNRASFLFQDFQAFSRICIHPRVLLDKSIDDQQKYQSDEESIGSLKDFIDDDSSTSTPNSSDSESDSNRKEKKKVTKRVTRSNKDNLSDSDSEDSKLETEKEWWQEYCDGEELDNIANSTKILMLFEILKECEQIGDKVLVFSQSLYALNVIEYFLEKVDEATQNDEADEKTCGYSGNWSPGLDYFRLDGSTNCSLRSEYCDSFNNERNSRARLFLLSTRAGGLGINLVAANRVILFDVSWNPSSDIQSIYRVYRFGQLKPTYIYRFVMYGTMEMKIYERQVTKQAISKRVIDEQQIDRHYNQSDLAELYKFEEPELDVRPIPLVPKDVLLGELLQNHEDKIYKYHEHQTLLENKEDETLNEEERKAAWDEFENEKVGRAKMAYIGKFSTSTVQLALRNIIHRDNPTWNNNQILSIIPQLIQQLNLQLNIGDKTMYNRIATEVQNMQNEYARRMQMQLYRMQLAGPNHQLANAYQQQLQFMNMGTRFPFMGPNAGASNMNPITDSINPNDVVELN